MHVHFEDEVRPRESWKLFTLSRKKSDEGRLDVTGMMLETGISPAKAGGGESIGRGVSVCPGVEGDFVSEGGAEEAQKRSGSQGVR